MSTLIVLLLIIGIPLWLLVKFAKWVSKVNGEEKRRQAIREADEALREAKRMMILAEVRRQAKIVGDTLTVEQINDMTYNGPLPELRDDGAYLSLYDNLRILKIAGMKYRGNLSAYVGDFKGILVPEPTNDYDPHAIMVKCEDGHHLGYIREEQTNLVRWLVGAEQPLGEETPTTFDPYRIEGTIKKCTDEADGHTFYDGCVYILQKDRKQPNAHQQKADPE